VHVRELRPPILFISDDVIIEASLPDAAVETDSRATAARERAVNLPDELTDRRFCRQRYHHVVVVGHDDVAVESDMPSVSISRVEPYQHLREIASAEERATLVGAARHEVGVMSQVNSRQPPVTHWRDSLGQDAKVLPYEPLTWPGSPRRSSRQGSALLL